MHRLRKLGLDHVGTWKIQSAALEFDIPQYKNERDMLYVFSANDRVLYIGQTSIQLQKRMYQYKRPNQTQRTNWRINKLLREYLMTNNTIDIHALVEYDELSYKGFILYLPEALERNLIRFIQPEWNKLIK